MTSSEGSLFVELFGGIFKRGTICFQCGARIANKVYWERERETKRKKTVQRLEKEQKQKTHKINRTDPVARDPLDGRTGLLERRWIGCSRTRKMLDAPDSGRRAPCWCAGTGKNVSQKERTQTEKVNKKCARSEAKVARSVAPHSAPALRLTKGQAKKLTN